MGGAGVVAATDVSTVFVVGGVVVAVVVHSGLAASLGNKIPGTGSSANRWRVFAVYLVCLFAFFAFFVS